MEKHKAIPDGFMTVGEIAKKMNVTVRTLQYYHKEGILSPSAESEGGRRLYTHKDIIRLHQIQSMKYLGFSLEDIKNRLPSIDTPQEVSAVLTEQAKNIRAQIKGLKEMLAAIEKLNAEVLQMDEVDWSKYADIIEMAQMGVNGYWVMKHLSENTVEHLRNNSILGGIGSEDMKNYKKVQEKLAALQKNGVPPESEEAQAVTAEWWGFVMKFTGGDPAVLSDLFAMGMDISGDEWKDNFSFDKEYLEKLMEHHLFRMYGDATERLATLQKSGVSPESEEAQAAVETWWGFVMQFTGGDPNTISKMFEAGEGMTDDDWNEKFPFERKFLETALAAHFTRIGYSAPSTPSVH